MNVVKGREIDYIQIVFENLESIIVKSEHILDCTIGYVRQNGIINTCHDFKMIINSSINTTYQEQLNDNESPSKRLVKYSDISRFKLKFTDGTTVFIEPVWGYDNSDESNSFQTVSINENGYIFIVITDLN